MKSLIKGHNEEIIAVLFVLQSKGQFGKSRSVAQLDAKTQLKLMVVVSLWLVG